MSDEIATIQEQYQDVLNTGNDAAISEFLNTQNISDVAELVEENEGKEIEITTNEKIAIPSMPPSPYEHGALMENVFVGKGQLNL